MATELEPGARRLGLAGAALVGCSVLGLSAAVAGISGFFDGQLGRSDLGADYVAMQLVFVVVAWAMAFLAASRLRRLSLALRGDPASIHNP